MKQNTYINKSGSDNNQNFPVTYTNIEAAAVRSLGRVEHTPVFTSNTVDRLTSSQVFFKCENFQRTGSFKFRGAYNALVQLPDIQKQRGVLTFSSGNHAQAIALSGQLLGIKTTIVMPDDAPAVKQEATRGYGAEVILYDRATTDREEFAKAIAQERGSIVIPPYDHPDIIAGQGTATRELIQEIGELDLLLVPCGGGGLISGSAISAKGLSPNCRIIGVEPANADDAARSFQTKTLQIVNNPNTIADGARTPCLGQLTFPIILQYVDDIVTVSEEAIKRTMFFLWERLKIVVEPTGALAAAALLEGAISAPDRRIGVIVSGGNVDITQIVHSSLFPIPCSLFSN
jgi:threonine dehydratase